jgi:hypothetical protein
MLWNYKTAILSALVRGAIFFATTASAGVGAAASALAAESGFRFVTAGFYGSLTQAFRRVQPDALGTAAAVVALPVIAHSLEFAVHSWRATPNLAAGMSASIAFTCASTAFNLFAMRRGALIVGEGQGSLGDDLRAMPRLLALFVATTVRACRRGVT